MFFMLGIMDGRKDLEFTQSILCDECNKYGRYNVFVTYMVLSLFFIPCLKWNKRYYVRTSCCNTLYELNPDIGKKIERGENIDIMHQNMTKVNNAYNRGYRHCNYCGYETSENFDYCPKCGKRFYGN